jgi:uncharacterized small protein (DUF1192 family)
MWTKGRNQKGASMDIEDLEPRNKVTKPKDLSGWNIEDLVEYVERMHSEITRAEAMIQSKRNVSSAAAALFKL